MKNTLKNSFYDKFIESMEDEQSFTEVQKRYISNKLAIEAVGIHDENFKKLSELHSELSINNEKTRSQFIGMDLVGKTTMVTDMVKFLNTLNELVFNFYKDVYQIEKVDEKEKQKEKIQASLF